MSLTSTLIADPTAGGPFNLTPLSRPSGSALNSENYITKNGALEMRPALSHISTDAAVGIAPGGLHNKGITPFFSNKSGHFTAFADRSWGWSLLQDGKFASITNAPGIPVSSAYDLYWDFAQIYSDIWDDNILVGAPSSADSVVAYRHGSSVASLNFLSLNSISGDALTFGAKCVASFDNYLLLGNIDQRSLGTPASMLKQRIHWSDRGSASSFTGGLSGFEDILAARGEIQRIVPLEDHLVVFFDDEIWRGTPVAFPFTFQFTPLDQSVGCPYRWTIARTPAGVAFMARDFQTYVLPAQGGTKIPFGDAVRETLKSDATFPERWFACYDPNAEQYELFYATSAGSYPRRGAFFSFPTNTWSFQSFPVRLSFGATSYDSGGQPLATLGAATGAAYYLKSTATSDGDDSVRTTRHAINAFWETKPLGGDMPAVQKTVNLVRVDYDTPSASSLTVRTSPSQGVGFSTGVGLALSPTSTVSQQPAYLRESSRYPVVRIEESSQSIVSRQRIHRLHIEMNTGGR